MTPEQLQAWARLAEQATPGEWEAKTITFWDDKNNNHMEIVTRLYKVARIFGNADNLSFAKSDAAFIAAARTAVPALCEEIERLRKVAGEARNVLNNLRSTYNSRLSKQTHDMLDFATDALDSVLEVKA